MQNNFSRVLALVNCCMSLEYPNNKSSLLYIEVWKIRWNLPAHQNRVVWSLIKSPMIICLIWLLFYEGSFSNSLQVWSNIVADTAVVLVLADIKQSSGDNGCILRTKVIFQRSQLNKHPMPSNPFELAVVLFSQSSAMTGVI